MLKHVYIDVIVDFIFDNTQIAFQLHQNRMMSSMFFS
jgi:hypothetical protein